MNGFYNVLKSTSMTSSDVVVKLRGILRSQMGVRYKVGHLGTLDPGGSGVLPIAVGNAVKLFNYLLDKPKVYRAQFVFGQTTDTLDSYGRLVAQGPRVCDASAVFRAADCLVGTYGQIPPLFSAKSVDGHRAYDLARRGQSVDLAPRTVTIYSITPVRHEANCFTFDIRCSGGTYVRSICRDMADRLGTVGYMRYIIRLQSGDFLLRDAHTLGEIEQDRTGCFVSLADWAQGLPLYTVPADYATAIRNGVVYEVSDMPLSLYRLQLGCDPYAIACAQNGRLKVICRLI